MKRDWNLIRTLLLTIEAAQGSDRYADAEKIETRELVERQTLPAIRYHLLHEVDVGRLRTLDGRAYGLTEEGRDFLDAFRSDRVWTAVQDAMERNGGGLPTDLLLEVARREWRREEVERDMRSAELSREEGRAYLRANLPAA